MINGMSEKKFHDVMDCWIYQANNPKLSYTEKLKLVAQVTKLTLNKLVATLCTEEAVFYIMEQTLKKDGLRIIEAVEKQHELLHSSSDKVALEASKEIVRRCEDTYNLRHSEVSESMSNKLKELLEDLSK